MAKCSRRYCHQFRNCRLSQRLNGGQMHGATGNFNRHTRRIPNVQNGQESTATSPHGYQKRFKVRDGTFSP